MTASHEINLNIKERLLLHLAQYDRKSEAFVRPKAVTQVGVTETLGISRAHAAVELRKAVDNGLVEESVRHIDGGTRQHKVYRLTEQGKTIANALEEMVGEKNVHSAITGPEPDAHQRRYKRSELLAEIHWLKEKVSDLERRAAEVGL